MVIVRDELSLWRTTGVLTKSLLFLILFRTSNVIKPQINNTFKPSSHQLKYLPTLIFVGTFAQPNATCSVEQTSLFRCHKKSARCILFWLRLTYAYRGLSSEVCNPFSYRKCLESSKQCKPGLEQWGLSYSLSKKYFNKPKTRNHQSVR